MNPNVKKIIFRLLPLIVAAAIIFVFRDQLSLLGQQIIAPRQPCLKPITYSIVSFDQRFGLTRDDFKKAIEQATIIWGQPIGKKLFAPAPAGELALNLIFDYRQESTNKLRKLGLVINDDQKTYDELKAKHAFLQKEYQTQKAALGEIIQAHETRVKIFNDEVASWNKKGGAPDDIFKRLRQEQTDLNAQTEEIRQNENALNDLVGNINALVNVLNKLARELNITASKYNNLGEQRGEEFTEGEYISDNTGARINIYEFGDKEKLVRVLAHELGHALGLDHINNKYAIMYRLNQNTNNKLTSDDLRLLKNICEIK